MKFKNLCLLHAYFNLLHWENNTANSLSDKGLSSALDPSSPTCIWNWEQGFGTTQFSYHIFSSKPASPLVAFLVTMFMFKVATTCAKHKKSGNLWYFYLSSYIFLYINTKLMMLKAWVPFFILENITAFAFITCQMKTIKLKF